MSRFSSDNLTGKMLRQLLQGLAAGLFVFLLLYFGGGEWLDQYFSRSDYFYHSESDRVEELQQYVSENGIAATDSEKLRKWAKEKDISDLTVSREKEVLFDASYEKRIAPGGAKIADYNWKFFHKVTFADGEADVYIYEGFAQKYYGVILGAAILSGLAVCLGIFIYGIREEVEYIRILKREVDIIGQGNLQEDVTVKGKDELAELASGLNRMRLKLIEKEETEQSMRSAQEELVLGMSHDLRTPLTGLLTYIEILKRQEQEGKISREYLDKVFDKTLQIRTLSDQMFEFFLINSRKSVALEPPEEIESALGDYLSELCALLECSSFSVDAETLEWKPVRVRINTDYVGRIMNNIISNLEKYGDRHQEIQIKITYEQDRAGVFIRNGIAVPNQYVQGTGIGVKNIALMMENMHGQMQVNMTEETYCIVLWFPICGQQG